MYYVAPKMCIFKFILTVKRVINPKFFIFAINLI